jgi:hypothetical protein
MLGIASLSSLGGRDSVICFQLALLQAAGLDLMICGSVRCFVHLLRKGWRRFTGREKKSHIRPMSTA